MFEPTTIHVYGKTVEVTPCSTENKKYVDDGYLVLSCRKCKNRAIPKGNA